MAGTAGITTARGLNAEGILGLYYALDNGVPMDGQADSSVPLTALIAALPAAGGTIVVGPGLCKLTNNVTVPTNVTLWILQGVTLSGAGSFLVSGTGTIVDYRGGLSVTGATSIGGLIVPTLVYVTSGVLAAASVSQPLWTPPNDSTTWKVASVNARFTVASTSGTLQIEAAPAATAVGAGVNQLTGTVSLAGAANTVVGGTVGTPTTMNNAYSLNLILAGTLTNLAGCVVVVALQRLS